MTTRILLASLSFALLAGCAGVEPRPLVALSDTVVKGFTFPESVGCDATERVLYVSQFGGTELKPAEKDGKGYISKVDLDGRVLEERAFPVTLNKPKGIWVEERRLWVTDIDGVWVFDTRSRQGRKLDIPGIVFANDVTVSHGTLYVSDNRSDQVFSIHPADFLHPTTTPTVRPVLGKRDMNPNGLWPARDGSILVAGFLAADKPRGVYSIIGTGGMTQVAAPIGRLDGIAEMPDGSLLVTDWNSGALFHWTPKGGKRDLAKDFKGPADFCVMGETAYVPDLVKGEVRIIRLGR